MRIQADLYLELLAVLIAPVFAIPEELAVYRIHGKNLCTMDIMNTSKEGTERLIVSTGTVMGEVRRWIREHPQRLGSVNPRRLLDRITLRLLERQFAFTPPARLHYFVFLLRQNYAFSPLQSWSKTVVKYLAALAALAFGYRRMRTLYARYGKHLSALRGPEIAS
jgi:hypothetical protein